MAKVTKDEIVRMAQSVRLSSRNEAADTLDELSRLCIDDDPEISSEAVRQALSIMLREQAARMRM